MNKRANILKNCGATTCEEYPRTLDDFLSGCTLLESAEYTIWHVMVGQYIHWRTSTLYVKENARHWYKQHLDNLTDIGFVTNIWDFKIDRGRRIKANRPDIVIKSHKNTMYFSY